MLYGLSWGCGPAAQRSGLFPSSILPTNQAFPPACKCPNPPSLFSMMTSLSSVRMGAIFPASSQPFAGYVSVFSPFPSGREVLLSRAFPSHSLGLAESGPSLRICLLNR